MRTVTSVVGAAILLTGLVFAAPPAWSQTDYSSMSTEELAAMRGTLRDAPAEEREAFRQEWRSRVSTMTQEERQSYGRPATAGSGDGAGLRQGSRSRQGSGAGMGMSRGWGRGMGRGRR